MASQILVSLVLVNLSYLRIVVVTHTDIALFKYLPQDAFAGFDGQSHFVPKLAGELIVKIDLQWVEDRELVVVMALPMFNMHWPKSATF